MNLEELRVGLAAQERFTPELSVVRDRVRLATEPEPHVRHSRSRRSLPVAASIAAVGLLALVITIVHGRPVRDDVAAPPTSIVAGTHWQLTAAAVAGMPDFGVQPDLTESLYLYPDGTSVSTGLCFTRQGRWVQRGSELIFTDQQTLPHRCPLDVQDTAPQRALADLDGTMRFTVDAAVLHLHNGTTTMTLKTAGAAPSNPGPSVGVPIDPAARVLADVTWQLTAAVQNGKDVALPPEKATMELYSDGVSIMVAPACFYQTGRWHVGSGGDLTLTDQVRPVMWCYSMSDRRQVAGGEVLAAMTGAIRATVNGSTLTLTLTSGHLRATFIRTNPVGEITPAPARTSSR